MNHTYPSLKGKLSFNQRKAFVQPKESFRSTEGKLSFNTLIKIAPESVRNEAFGGISLGTPFP